MQKNKIHIGWHRTGTTYFQKLIFPHVPNYEGRFYPPAGKSGDYSFNNRKFDDVDGFPELNVLETCQSFLEHWKGKSNIFISWEMFSKLQRKDLVTLLGDEWDVLVFDRELKSLCRSRQNRPAQGFYLQEKIDKWKGEKVPRVIKRHYDIKSLVSCFTDVTVVSYEKIFAGDEEELQRLSKYLNYDIVELHKKNIGRRIN